LLNGGGLASSVTNVTTASGGYGDLGIGVNWNNTTSYNDIYNGWLADIAIWRGVPASQAAGTTEALALTAGVSPLRIRPEELIFYMPATNSSHAIDFMGQALTVNGSPGDAAGHPALFGREAGMVSPILAAAAAGGAEIPASFSTASMLVES
jgi:hypothetical protein